VHRAGQVGAGNEQVGSLISALTPGGQRQTDAQVSGKYEYLNSPTTIESAGQAALDMKKNYDANPTLRRFGVPPEGGVADYTAAFEQAKENGVSIPSGQLKKIAEQIRLSKHADPKMWEEEDFYGKDQYNREMLRELAELSSEKDLNEWWDRFKKGKPEVAKVDPSGVSEMSTYSGLGGGMYGFE